MRQTAQSTILRHTTLCTTLPLTPSALSDNLPLAATSKSHNRGVFCHMLFNSLRRYSFVFFEICHSLSDRSAGHGERDIVFWNWTDISHPCHTAQHIVTIIRILIHDSVNFYGLPCPKYSPWWISGYYFYQPCVQNIDILNMRL